MALLAGLLSACGRAASTEPPADGARLFARACARCHAEDGSGGMPTVPDGPRPIDLRGADWQRSRTDEQIASAIRDGYGAMPPFRDVLTASEVTVLVAHVRRLAAGASPAAADH